jgi:hypothetical protein
MQESLKNGCDCLEGKITILGKRGTMTCADGLRIAYISGSESDGLQESDIESILMARDAAGNTETDILISPVWPKGISFNCTLSIPEAVMSRSSVGSMVVSKLVQALKPRYVVSSSTPSRDNPTGVFFERQPFRNHVVLQEQQKAVTRFISLAAVSSDKKDPKWLYAFNIKPASSLLLLGTKSGTAEGRRELCSQPEDTTESPFSGLRLELRQKRPREQEDTNLQFFFKMPPEKRQQRQQNSGDEPNRESARHVNQERDNDNTRENRQDHKPRDNSKYEPRDQNRELTRRPQDNDPESCWFCLASPKVEKQHVISIGNHCYLATAKGGLVRDHLLILPIKHVRCSLDLDKECQDEMEKMKTALIQYFDSQNKFPVFFERNYKSSHMQIQVVPIPKDKASLEEESTEVDADENDESDKPSHKNGIKSMILRILRCEKLNWTDIPIELNLLDIQTRPGPYFYLQVPLLSIQLMSPIRREDKHGNQLFFNLQLGRVICAEILGIDCQEVQSWRRVTESLTANEEAERAMNFRDRFKPFDFTLEDDDE